MPKLSGKNTLKKENFSNDKLIHCSFDFHRNRAIVKNHLDSAKEFYKTAKYASKETKEVIEKMIQAHGGYEKWKNLKTLCLCIPNNIKTKLKCLKEVCKI